MKLPILLRRDSVLFLTAFNLSPQMMVCLLNVSLRGDIVVVAVDWFISFELNTILVGLPLIYCMQHEFLCPFLCFSRDLGLYFSK